MSDSTNKINLKPKKLIILDLSKYLYRINDHINKIKTKYPFINEEDLLTSLLTMYDVSKLDYYERSIDKVFSIYYLDRENLEEDIDFITSLECMYVDFIDEMYDIWSSNELLNKIYDYDEDTLEAIKFLDKNSVIFKLIKYHI